MWMPMIWICMAKFGYILICFIGKYIKAVSFNEPCSKQFLVSFLSESPTES